MACPHAYETRHVAGDVLPTHRHDAAYVALVLEGMHVEHSVDGALACGPGTLLVHPRFHAHGNRFSSHVRVLNLPLGPGRQVGALIAVQVDAIKEACCVLAHGDAGALGALLETARAVPRPLPAWQSRMLEALGGTDRPIRDLAADLGVSAAYATRAMTRTFGMAPQALRRELRWRHALDLLQHDLPLADVAAQAGFADQSHFNRVVRRHCGLSPGRLRAQVNCVQDGARRLRQDHGAPSHTRTHHDPTQRPPPGRDLHRLDDAVRHGAGPGR